MARYALRNQQKIKEVYGTSVLERMKVSLDTYFKADDIKPEEWETNEPYPIISIDDKGHSFGLICFYVTSVVYDVYHLAFKEFVS